MHLQARRSTYFVQQRGHRNGVRGRQDGAKRHGQIEGPIVREHVVRANRRQGGSRQYHGERHEEDLVDRLGEEMKIDVQGISEQQTGQKHRQEDFAVDSAPLLDGFGQLIVQT